MKYAWKDSNDNIRTMEVLSGSPESFLPEGGTLIGQIPSEIDSSDYSYLQEVGGVISVNEATKTVSSKNDQISLAHAEMNSDVYAQMTTVFGTSNAESASAYERTWQVMKANPSSFVGVGIKDDEGNEFTTEQAVTNFADSKLASVLSYGVWRMQRIEQFRTLRSTILGS